MTDDLLQLSKQIRENADKLAAAVKAGREQVAQNKANDQKAHEQYVARQAAQKEATKCPPPHYKP